MDMKFMKMKKEQWGDIKEIYMEAFPKRERKPFFVLKHSVKNGKVQIFTAMENGTLLGFVMVILYQDMVMVDYLAVSSKVRGKGTGSFIMKKICNYFSQQKIVLLIERLDENAENSEQRSARRKFYLKNGFTSSGIFIDGAGGNMEVLNYGRNVTANEYIELQKYALGRILFRLSKIKIV